MLFPAPADFKKIETDPVVCKNGYLHVPDQVFEDLAFAAFRDVSHLLRPAHLSQIRTIFDDPQSLPNERFAALEFLKNANIASGMVLPLCQDTGTAIVIGEKGHRVLTDGTETEALTRGIKKAYTSLNLRYSQNIPLSMFSEKTVIRICPRRLTSAPSKAILFVFCSSPKAVDQPIKPFCFNRLEHC